jgi:gas vesicle protein
MLVGAVIGAGLALMFAPMAGSETRRRIGEAARKAGNGARERADGLMGALKDGAGDVGAAIDAGKEAYRQSAGRSPVQHEHA